MLRLILYYQVPVCTIRHLTSMVAPVSLFHCSFVSYSISTFHFRDESNHSRSLCLLAGGGGRVYMRLGCTEGFRVHCSRWND